MKKKIAVIGSGFAGISAATVLAEQGQDVHLYEKNETIGGRARQFSAEGFLFDMGPSWYWMPDVFERYFKRFGYEPRDFYDLKLLDPGFTMVFEGNEIMDVPANFDELCDLFESIEKGAADKLKKFMNEAAYKYEVGINDLVYKPGLSLTEFADFKLFKDVFRLQLFSSFSDHVKKFFKHPKLVALMEFPVLFLGAMPEKTPALYSLMNYAGLKMGTYYPMGGFHKVIQGMKKIAEEKGVRFYQGEPVQQLEVNKNLVHHVSANGHSMDVDAVIGAADYHHIESKLLAKEYRNYDEKYWDKKTFAPSSLLFYLGVDKKVPKLKHHTLFFDNNLKQHSKDIYVDPKWPEKPLFYVCCPSKTDPETAPEGKENIFILMPIAPGLKDNDATREEYYNILMERLEDFVGEDIRNHIIYKRSYCVNDFVNDYNAYKGNAYGLANTLMQTAILKPRLKSRKVNNLYFAGQLTVPGPGVPPSIISGQVAAKELLKQIKTANSMKALFDKVSTHCSEYTTKKYSTSFSLGINFLDKKYHTPIYNIYGFVRFADEIVDTFEGYDQKRLLDRFWKDTYEAIDDGISLNPILNSFQHTVNKYNIERELIDTFMRSMAMDLNKSIYDVEGYKEYILGSAEVVGLMCLRVFTDGDEANYQKLKPFAMRLGAAFQKVNFLRDAKADFEELGRSYFPGVNLAEFTHKDKLIIEKEIAEDFEEALKGIKMLPRGARRGVYLAYIYYQKLFTKIKSAPADRVMNERIRISNPRKFGLMMSSMVRYKFNLL